MSTDSMEYAAQISTPSEQFSLTIEGIDADGTAFTYSDDKEMAKSTIDITLSVEDYALRGNSLSFVVLMTNMGAAQSFDLRIENNLSLPVSNEDGASGIEQRLDFAEEEFEALIFTLDIPPDTADFTELVLTATAVNTENAADTNRARQSLSVLSERHVKVTPLDESFCFPIITDNGGAMVCL